MYQLSLETASTQEMRMLDHGSRVQTQGTDFYEDVGVRNPKRTPCMLIVIDHHRISNVAYFVAVYEGSAYRAKCMESRKHYETLFVEGISRVAKCSTPVPSIRSRFSHPHQDHVTVRSQRPNEIYS